MAGWPPTKHENYQVLSSPLMGEDFGVSSVERLRWGWTWHAPPHPRPLLSEPEALPGRRPPGERGSIGIIFKVITILIQRMKSLGGVGKVLFYSSGSCLRQIPAIVINMESLAGSDDLSILYPNLLRHIFLQQLKTSEIGWKSSPQVPRTKVEHKMEFPITNTRINATKALGVLE